MNDQKSKNNFDQENCIFCKIVAGKLPSSILYEDDMVMAFLDIAPVNQGHTLIIPKKHFETALQTQDEVLSHIMKIAKKIAPAIESTVGSKGFNITFNNGAVAGQIVPHAHLHIIPRHKSDGLKMWPQVPYPNDEQKKIANSIKSSIT